MVGCKGRHPQEAASAGNFIRSRLVETMPFIKKYAVVDIVGEIGIQQGNSRSRQLNAFNLFLISLTESNIFSAI